MAALDRSGEIFVAIRYYTPFAPLAAVPLAQQLDMIWYLPIALIAAFITLDVAVGVEPETLRPARAPIAHRLVPWLYIPLQLAALLWGAAVAPNTSSNGDLLGLAVALGLLTGIFGMLAAHEMIHSPYRSERRLGIAMLAAVGYAHFAISHRLGHHRRAGTYEDPATARRGESAYRFFGRSIVGQAAEAWAIERRRGSSLRQNRLIRYVALTLAIYAGLGAVFGIPALLFQVIVSAIAIVVLELFNYVAHYGLMRTRRADGTPEPFRPCHAWNVPQRFNNWAQLNDGRHSDHHARPATPYEQLHPVSGLPELPAGYAGSILLALVPPLWRRVMDPRIDRVALLA